MTTLNDDELEQNWVAESVEVDGNSDVEVEDDENDGVSADLADEESTEKLEPKESSKKRQLETNETEPTKKKKKQVFHKPIHKMTRTELFKIVNDTYVKMYGDKMTPMEIANGLTEDQFTHVPHTLIGKHTMQSFTRFLRHLCPRWKFLFKGKGMKDKRSPIILIVCSSALRAVEIGKAIAEFNCQVAKLFGKHIKKEEQVEMLKRFCPIAIGTPGRIKDLLEMQALSLECTTHVVIDMYRDSKDMTIFELKDTAKDTIDMIRENMLTALSSQKLSIALY